MCLLHFCCIFLRFQQNLNNTATLASRIDGSLPVASAGCCFRNHVNSRGSVLLQAEVMYTMFINCVAVLLQFCRNFDKTATKLQFVKVHFLQFCCSFVEISTKLQQNCKKWTLTNCSFVAVLSKFRQNCNKTATQLINIVYITSACSNTLPRLFTWLRKQQPALATGKLPSIRDASVAVLFKFCWNLKKIQQKCNKHTN